MTQVNWLSIGEAAVRTELSRSTLRRYFHAGKLDGNRLPSGQIRFRVEDLDELVPPVPNLDEETSRESDLD